MATRLIKGTLTSTTPVPVTVESLSCPFTVTLNSDAAGRKIRLSTNGRAEFFEPSTDPSSTSTMLIVTVESPVTDVEFTAEAGDTWAIAHGEVLA